MNHTPGPWKITDAEFIDDAKGGPVARVYSQMRPKDEWQANAALIAAAPELLEALKALYNPEGSRFDRMADIHQFAQGAIAKADGRA